MDNGTPPKKPPAPSAGERAGFTLTLRKAKVQALISGWNPDIWSDDDYCILDDERRVGRIYPELIHGERRWLWFLQTEPAPPPNHGMCDTLEEAKAGFKARYAEGRGQMTDDLKAQIASQLYIALQRLDADEELLSIVGSWRDTLTDAEALELLQDYNATGRALHPRQ